MKQRYLVNILTAAALLLTLSAYTAAVRASNFDGAGEDTDTRMIDARVVEVTDARISVMARTGVEHVIAIDRADTKVTIDGLVVALQDLREGDVVTVDLDADNPMKFAKNISMRSDNAQLARNRR